MSNRTAGYRGHFKVFMSLLIIYYYHKLLNCCLCHRLRKKNVMTPYVVNIHLLEGHISPSEGQSTEVASVTAERWYIAPGVRRIDIRENGLVGTLFLPPGEQIIWSTRWQMLRLTCKGCVLSTRSTVLTPCRPRSVSSHVRPVGNGWRIGRISLCPCSIQRLC